MCVMSENVCQNPHGMTLFSIRFDPLCPITFGKSANPHLSLGGSL